MIALHGCDIRFAWLPITRILIGDLEAGRDLARIQFYAELLATHPDQDTDPIIVEDTGLGCYSIYNGHHRFIAHVVSGRPVIGCIIVEELYRQDE